MNPPLLSRVETEPTEGDAARAEVDCRDQSDPCLVAQGMERPQACLRVYLPIPRLFSADVIPTLSPVAAWTYWPRA
jgi:hypothetical protein